MKIVPCALLAVAMLGGIASGYAQSNNPPPAGPRLRAPDAIGTGIDVTRGPLPPPEHPFVPPPPSLGQPMERIPQVAPLAPRIGQ